MSPLVLARFLRPWPASWSGGLCLLGLAACSAPGAEPYAPGSAGGKADSAGDRGQVPLLAPAYALEIESTTEVLDRETGEVSDYTTRAGVLAEVTQDGADLTLLLSPCWIDLPRLGDHELEVPDEVVASVDPVTARGRLVADGAVVRLGTEPAALVVGARLDDPLGDPLPQDPEAPQVFDQDGDGEPGVSVHVVSFFGGLSVFAAARLVFDLEAEVPAGGESLAGSSAFSLDTAVYGDTIPFFDARESAAQAAGSSEVLSADHHFTMRPFDPAAACPARPARD